MDPLLVVIVTFGLIFVITASLAQGFSVSGASLKAAFAGHAQFNVMLLISNFVVLPALLIGLAALIPFDSQVKMGIVVLAVTAGAPFIPWLVAQGKGDVGYSAGVSILLLLATLIVLPLVMPPLLRALDTGATPSTWLVAWPMLLFILLPLVLGWICRARYPNLTSEIAPWLGPIS